jgi:hypothetical protein
MNDSGKVENGMLREHKSALLHFPSMRKYMKSGTMARPME